MRVVLQGIGSIGSSIDLIGFYVFKLKEIGSFKHWNLTEYLYGQSKPYKHWLALAQFVQMVIPHSPFFSRFFFCFLLREC